MFGRKKNEEHWDALGARYSEVWRNRACSRISAHELGFIAEHCPRLAGEYLDIGCGNGRILALLDTLAPAEARISGLDIAESMIEVCRKLPLSRAVRFYHADIAADGLPSEAGEAFVCITAIRVLKYNAEWKEAVKALAGRLAVGGVLIFSMTNKRSLNIFGRPPVKIYRATQGELRELANRCGLEIIDFRGFSRIPDIFYRIPGRLADWVLAAGEAALGLVFGKRFLQRVLFIALRRPG